MESKFKRIVLHWTAGASTPSAYDKQFYHYLIDAKGNIINGIHKPEDNLICQDGSYAAHCGGGNTGAIGVALCGMANFSYTTLKTPYHLTKIQLESMFSFVAKLCKRYNLDVTKDSVLTHFEFGLDHPDTTSSGKIDICYMQPYSAVHKYQVGNFIRSKVKWYLDKQLA